MPPNERSGGSTSEQIACASGQRVRKRQPDGGVIADGSSPRTCTTRRARAATGSGIGDRVDQAARVRVRRPLVDVVGRADLDELAEVHDADRVGQVLDDGEVVRDDDVGQLVHPLQLAHQVEDLRLDRDVECRDGLVGDDQLRVQRERPGQPDALALPARELVRVELGRFG